MYVPKFNRESDPATLESFIHEHSFALIVTADDDGTPFATHMPVAYDPSRGTHGAIVGFELEITRLEGKAKLSQNKSIGDQRRVIEALQASNGASERAVAALMIERLPVGDI